MVIATHQPIFLPWPGFFHKAIHADCMVLLDDVQFPRGTTWLNRNRLKNEQGELRLTVPVLKKGRGLQAIRHVEIHDGVDWRKKHLGGIRQNYVHAPYFATYAEAIEAIYAKGHSLLVDLNIDLIHFLKGALAVATTLVRQSKIGVAGQGTELLIAICEQMGAKQYLTFPMVDKHIEIDKMKARGIDVVHARFHPPIYPQLWGDFIYNLSTLDLLFNCGPKAREIVAGAPAHL
jgi:hypothetical protein